MGNNKLRMRKMKLLLMIVAFTLSTAAMANISCVGSVGVETVKLKIIEETSTDITYEGKIKDVQFMALYRIDTNKTSMLININSLGFAVSGDGPSLSQPKAYIDAGTAAGESFELTCRLLVAGT